MNNLDQELDKILRRIAYWNGYDSAGEWERTGHEAKAQLEEYIADQVAKAVEAKNNAYWERNQLVAYIASQYEAHMVRHPEDDKEWEDDWRWIICVHTPQGQLSWHIHDDEVPYFGWLEVEPDGDHWDGHTTEEKYDRITELRSKE